MSGIFAGIGRGANAAAAKSSKRHSRSSEAPAVIADLIRDPYVLEFVGLAEKPHYRESDPESALLDHLQGFLLELGAGFCFEARQKRITVGNEHDYIDLVFYHRRLRCHVLTISRYAPSSLRPAANPKSFTPNLQKACC